MESCSIDEILAKDSGSSRRSKLDGAQNEDDIFETIRVCRTRMRIERHQ